MKHTKGTWQVLENGLAVYSENRNEEIPFNGQICRLHTGLNTYENSEANAHLIASAPEMLEHIQYISKNLKYIFENFEDILPYNQTFIDMVNKSDRLIKKAKNEL